MNSFLNFLTRKLLILILQSHLWVELLYILKIFFKIYPHRRKSTFVPTGRWRELGKKPMSISVYCMSQWKWRWNFTLSSNFIDQKSRNQVSCMVVGCIEIKHWSKYSDRVAVKAFFCLDEFLSMFVLSPSS